MSRSETWVRLWFRRRLSGGNIVWHSVESSWLYVASCTRAKAADGGTPGVGGVLRPGQGAITVSV